MIIYRIEDKNGLGYKGRGESSDYISLDDYSRNCINHFSFSTYYEDDKRPIFWNDNIPRCFVKRNGWFFGFSSIEEVLRWFSPYDLFIMGYFGGLLVEYDIDSKNVWKGGNQCVFFKKRAKIIIHYNLQKLTNVKDFGEWLDIEEFNYMKSKENK